MKILNFGSLNRDYVYEVDHIVKAGETLSSFSLKKFCGGKGLNQSIALAKAGMEVYQAGTISTDEDGESLLEQCQEFGINTKYLNKKEIRNGHTMIQVDKEGQNCIILFGGSNMSQTKEYIDSVLNDFGKDDILVLQNEINLLDYIIDKAYKRGMNIILNPSPFNDKILECNLKQISIFMINEIEGEQMTGVSDPTEILDKLKEMYPDAKVVLTLGSEGSIYQDSKVRVKQDAFKVKAVDTTAAGDTFAGYFISSIYNNLDISTGLKLASIASSIAVSREGASPSIPYMKEVKETLGSYQS